MTYPGILERHGPMTVPFLPYSERPGGLSGGPSFSPTLPDRVAPPLAGTGVVAPCLGAARVRAAAERVPGGRKGVRMLAWSL